MAEFGPILEGLVVPVESLLGTSSGFKAQYKNLKKNSIAHKQATASIEKLAAGSLKIGDKNIRKIRGMKNIYEAKSKYARVYFQINGDTVQTILPALKIDQKERFIGLDKGPKSRDDVLHLYNFKDIRNNAKKPFLVQAVLNGAEQAGYTDGIRFLNYE